MLKFQTNTEGFTIVELLIVISIIGILAGIVIFVPSNLQKSAKSQEQAEDTASIMRRLESAYTNQEIGSPSYPSTAELLADISSDVRTATRVDPEIFRAPGASGSSVVAATTNVTANPAGASTPTLSQYVYQPLRADGALCTANPSSSSASTQCVRFNLYYRGILDNQIYQLKSLHQQ